MLWQHQAFYRIICSEILLNKGFFTWEVPARPVFSRQPVKWIMRYMQWVLANTLREIVYK